MSACGASQSVTSIITEFDMFDNSPVATPFDQLRTEINNRRRHFWLIYKYNHIVLVITVREWYNEIHCFPSALERS